MTTEHSDYSGRPIKDWLIQIKNSEIGLPLFQRGFVWKKKKVAELFHALLSGYPVGTLTLCHPLVKEGRISFETKNFYRVKESDRTKYEEIVLDGQQRLTSIWNALVAKGFSEDGFQIFVKVKDIDAEDLVLDEVEYVSTKSDIVDSPKAAKKENKFPISILGIDGVTQEKFACYNWCKVACDNAADKTFELAEKINLAFGEPLRATRLWYVKLPRSTTREQAIDIFIKTNESSAIVSRFDIAVAEFDKKFEDALRKMIEDTIDETNIIEEYFGREEKGIRNFGELILKIACLRKGLVPTDGSFTKSEVINCLKQDFGSMVDGVKWAFEKFSEESIWTKLPSDVPLRVLPALHPTYEAIKSPDNRSKANRIIRAYLWRAFLTDRYDRSVNTRLHQDFLVIKETLEKLGTARGNNDLFGAPIFESKWPLPKTEDLSDLRNPPNQKTTRALAVIGLKKGARDFATGQRVSQTQISQREKHHLFPKAFLKRGNVDDRKAINHALNYALVEKATNRVIGRKPPVAYLRDRFKGDKQLSDSDLTRRVESHLIPFAALNVDETNVRTNYEKFIRARAKLFAEPIECLTKGENWPNGK